MSTKMKPGPTPKSFEIKNLSKKLPLLGPPTKEQATPRETPPDIWPFPTYKGQPLPRRRAKKPQPLLPQGPARW